MLKESEVGRPKTQQLKILNGRMDPPVSEPVHRTSRFRRPSAGVPPLPIPNREVKPCSADGTGVTPGRVGRRHIIQSPQLIPAGFCVLYPKYRRGIPGRGEPLPSIGIAPALFKKPFGNREGFCAFMAFCDLFLST
ncbi:hypothetical protein SAMN04488104_105125 [Algoriphagus faecimaris]|uniref:Uncharacterized protein n=1 Tax=Algoriphagus faecimaris TaxID=686796 RepID=A0A1G6X7U0_9BACT|nr:hypothetical protein SAMN04488104_105125 [Algoriphagus faecimaris]